LDNTAKETTQPLKTEEILQGMMVPMNSGEGGFELKSMKCVDQKISVQQSPVKVPTLSEEAH